MSDYIKREDAQRALVHTLKDAEIDNACNEQDWYCQGLMDAGVAIDAVPSADVVPYYDYCELKKKYDKLEEDYDDLTEFHTGAMMYLTEVVRCKDCKWWNQKKRICELMGIIPPSREWYCSYGEREEQEHE